jgi:hypothetical protein
MPRARLKKNDEEERRYFDMAGRLAQLGVAPQSQA